MAPLYQVWKISMSKPPNFETPTPGLKVCRSQDLKVEARGSGRSKSSHLPSNVAHVRPTAISHVGSAFPVKCRSLPNAIWILDILLHISLQRSLNCISPIPISLSLSLTKKKKKKSREIPQNMPFFDVSKYQKEGEESSAASVNGIRIFYATYGRGKTKVLLIIGLFVSSPPCLLFFFFLMGSLNLCWMGLHLQDWRVPMIRGVLRLRALREPRHPLMLNLWSLMRISMTQMRLRSAHLITEAWVGAPCPPTSRNTRQLLSLLSFCGIGGALDFRIGLLWIILWCILFIWGMNESDCYGLV